MVMVSMWSNSELTRMSNLLYDKKKKLNLSKSERNKSALLLISFSTISSGVAVTPSAPLPFFEYVVISMWANMGPMRTAFLLYEIKKKIQIYLKMKEEENQLFFYFIFHYFE